MKKREIIIYIILVIFTVIICNGYLTGHFAADTFRIVNIGYERYAIEYSLTDGRILMGLITLFANAVRMPITMYICILEFLAILVSCLAVMVLKRIISKYKESTNIFQDIILTIACYYTIFNYTFLENMYFVESFVMALSILRIHNSSIQNNKNRE